ncbi:MAG TPA: Hsp70 family protein [Kofleriaceae bacterium]|nr:Hsp70 family protein [Kofleriaceae bacterium]
MIGLDLGSETVRVAALVDDRPVPVTAFPALLATAGARVEVGRAAAALPESQRQIAGTSAERLAWLVRAAVLAVEEAHGPVLGAVFAVSTSLGAVERRALRDAASIAGIPLARLVSTPVAIALSLPSAPDGRWLVCDAGSGSFTATVVDRSNGAVDRLATEEDLNLGGRALGRVVVEHLARGLDPAPDLADPALVAAAAALREHLGNAAGAEAALAAIADGAPHLKALRPPRRDELELWMAPRVRKVDDVCTRALAAAGIAASELSEVVLAGGGARLNALSRRLGQVMARPPRLPADPGFAAAIGAARIARMFVAEPAALIVDVVPNTLALAYGGEPTPLVPAGSVLPTREARVLTTRDDDERAIEVELWEQVSPPRALGRWRLGDLPSAPAGDVVAICNVTVDADGIPRLTASEMVSGAALLVTPVGMLDSDGGLDAETVAARRATVTEWRP